MMSVNRTARVVAIAGFGLLAVPTMAQEPATLQVQDAPTVIARVGDVEVTGVDIAIAAEQAFEQLMQLDETQRPEFLLQTVVDMTLMAEAARDRGLDDDALMQRRLAFAEAQLLQRAYVDAVVRDATSEPALRAAYDDYVAGFESVEQRRFSHILTASKEAADKAVVQIAAGEDFAAVAKAVSVDPAAQTNVDLGFLADGEMVGPLNDAGFALTAVGQVSAPVSTQFGWHILRFEERRESEPEIFEASRDRLVSELSETALRRDLARLAEQSPVEILDRTGQVE